MLHHTSRPTLSTSRWNDLDAAVRAVVAEQATGCLTIAGDRCSGSIFFEDGDVTFALALADEVTSLLDPAWLGAADGDDWDDRRSVVSTSVSASEITGQLAKVIDTVITLLRTNEATTIEFETGSAPVMTSVAFKASEWFDLSPSTAFGIYRLTRIA